MVVTNNACLYLIPYHSVHISIYQHGYAGTHNIYMYIKVHSTYSDTLPLTELYIDILKIILSGPY